MINPASMNENVTSPADLTSEQNSLLIIDFLHRTMMHYAMWYGEVLHQYGPEKARQILKTAYERSYDIQVSRLAKTLGFEFRDGIPGPLLDLPPEKLIELRDNLAVNWLANDGIWFQAVEFSKGLFDAKRCNDSCWGQFSPFEAWSIKKFLGLPDNPGLDGLKKALQFRLYAFINKQSFTDETPTGFIFQMNECRVQTARKRKGLEDYPCKSGGFVEYTTFAETIDPDIKTECLACPPDPHPGEYFCAWRFYTE
jgi:hypothetical protein